MTPSERFEAIGKALYGPTWRTVLAEQLDLNERTVRRYANDGFPIPPGIWADLRAICRNRIAELRAVEADLDRLIGGSPE